MFARERHQAPPVSICRSLTIGMVVVAGLAMSGCQSLSLGGGDTAPASTASLGEGSITATAEAGQRWRDDPGNAKLGLKYALELQELGQIDEQLQVLAEISRRNPDDLELAAYYGKQLTHNARAADGERALRRVVEAGKADWKVHSALGSALDQQGKFAEARQHYKTALDLDGKPLTVLNNMGMSYLLEGDLKSAEATFREASALPNGANEPRLRQNLALTVGLQGRFEEARDIASRDLPHDVVEANMTFLRSMLSQPNNWQQLKPSPTNS